VSDARRWARPLNSSPLKIVAVIAVVAGLVWWQWPTIDGHDSRTDVVLLTDGFLTSAEVPVDYRIREDGHTMEWESGATSWCDAANAVSRVRQNVDPAAIVLSFGSATGCDATAVTDAVKAAGGHTVLVVSQPGASGVEAAASDAGATVIDPSRFIGDQPTATSMPCQWWDTCTADGTVPVRSADGSLTPEGGDRVARMIVAQLP
jgi:hypothetical protein